MSHTDRHRPYWVQAAEHGTREHHDHRLFGQPRVVRRKKRDSRGRVIMTMQPVAVTLYKALSYPVPSPYTPLVWKRIMDFREEARRRITEGEFQWTLIDGPDDKLQPVMEDYVYGHWADHCTIDEPQRAGERLAGTSDVFAPCGMELEGEDRSKAFKRYPGERRAGIHRDWRRPSRRKVRNATRAITKDADTFVEAGELESDLYDR